MTDSVRLSGEEEREDWHAATHADRVLVDLGEGPVCVLCLLDMLAERRECKRCRHPKAEHSAWGDPLQVGEAPDSCADCALCAHRNARLAERDHRRQQHANGRSS